MLYQFSFFPPIHGPHARAVSRSKVADRNSDFTFIFMNHTRSIRWADTTLKWCGGRAAWQNDTFSFCLYIHGPHANVVNRFHASQTQYSMICLPPHNASEGALFSNSGSILDPCRIHSGPLGAELVPWTGMPIFFTTSDSRRFAHGIAKAMLDPNEN